MTASPDASRSRSEAYVVVWCPDCNGVDFQGCFDGGVQRHGPFETREEATRVGEEMVKGSNWLFEVEGPDRPDPVAEQIERARASGMKERAQASMREHVDLIERLRDGD